VNWRWVEEGDGYVGRLQPPGQPLGVGLPSGLQCLVPYPYVMSATTETAAGTLCVLACAISHHLHHPIHLDNLELSACSQHH
jgi:hypothetical protein